MASTPTTEPAAITAGDSFTWQKTLADYPAGTWTLTVTTNGSAPSNGIVVTVVPGP